MNESTENQNDGSDIGGSTNPETASTATPATPTPPAPPAATHPVSPTPPSAYAPPTANYSPPSATQNQPYSPPTPGIVPPAFSGGVNQHPEPAPHLASTVPQPGYGQASLGEPAGQAPTGATTVKRGARVGIIAALAVGALVGGVSGAGVAALAISSGQQGSSSQTTAGPANITVNDATDATTITAVAAATGPSVVTISVADQASGSGGTGSGVILTDDGYILTNTHVVTLDGATGAPTISVQTSDGHLYTAELVGTDPIVDLAVIKVDAGSIFKPAEFADSSDLNVGDVAIAIGAPLGLANTVTNGIVSSLNRSITVASSAAPQTEEAPDANSNGDQGPFDFWQNGQENTQTQASATIALPVIQTDAAINPGNSGGALLDSEGKVIGINVAIASAGSGDGSSQAGSIGVGFAIPSNLADRVANEIISTGTGTHGLLGATVSDAAANSDVVGASIQTVSPSGAAQTAGLRAGDVITAINDLPVTGKNDLTAQVRALAGGADATITYQRGGKSSQTDVTLGTLK